MQKVEYLSFKKPTPWIITGRLAVALFFLILGFKFYILLVIAITILCLEFYIYRQKNEVSEVDIRSDMILTKTCDQSPIIISTSEIIRIEEDIVYGTKLIKIFTKKGNELSFISAMFKGNEYERLKDILKENYMKIDSQIKSSRRKELILQIGFITIGLSIGLIQLFYFPSSKAHSFWYLNPLAAFLGILNSRIFVKLYLF